MARHTSSPQPHAVERKDKHPANETKSNLAGSEHNKKNARTKQKK